MSGAKSVRKGKVHERRAAVELRRVWSDSKRSLQYQREHGVGDVEAGPLSVEVKSYTVSTANIWRKAEAARKASKSKRKVTAVVQPSGTATGPVLITLPLKAFVKLLTDAKRLAEVPCVSCGGDVDEPQCSACAADGRPTDDAHL